MAKNCKGLMLIPEGTRDRSCKDKGYPSELTNISNLEGMIGYAEYYSLGYAYFYSAYGICCIDDIYEYASIKLSKLSKDKFTMWYCIMANKIQEMCIAMNVNQVHFMVRSVNKYSQLIKALEHSGISVILPIAGMSDKLAKDTLSKYAKYYM